MKQFAVIALFLLPVAFTFAAENSGHPDRIELPLPGRGETQVLQIDITTSGKSPQIASDLFITKVLSHFDRNQDGTLDETETAKVFPFPLPANKAFTLRMADADLNGDHKIQPSELGVYCEKQGFQGLSGTVLPPTADDRHLGSIFAAALDSDGNGKIEQAELNAAARRLLKYDFNDDEILDWRELLAAAPKLAQPSPKGETNAVGNTSLKLRIDLGDQFTATLVDHAQERKPRLSVANERFTLVDSDNAFVLSGSLQRELPNVSTAAEFLVAQLTTALGDQKTLSKSAVKMDESLSALMELFGFADRNADDELSEQEMREYLALIAMATSTRLVVRVRNHDRNLFSYLDADGDLRLTPVELAQFRNLPLSESGQTPQILRLQFGGPELSNWGGVRIPTTLPAKPKLPMSKQQTPAWFQAQDRNGDQVVSQREFLGPTTTFRQFDQNGDALIDAAEGAVVR